ncbi:hypothetical protein [Runella slithyformis]|uniref:Uncharacterized protein n=1 Tax=Runella slithyformis (strain ATCC 29530 / DSM 19594 / LMG 11500 / NCIMB 11436 / LSU 4) TaxID=761193 RepID=A0A7U3ZQ26_RUNSL|nr:hypothetical protein [Runella slithyformis]AEI51285.1 hypothetical protein Runsl_4976 [Runella slithyformis DSM 19594]
MITTVVGRTFLEAYNKKYQSNKSPKEFFEEVYFELFYNHSKYMQWITNSPFVQGIRTSDENIFGREIGKTTTKDEILQKQLFDGFEDQYGKNRVLLKTDRQKGKITYLLINDKLERQERLQNFHQKVENNEPDGSFALGFPASDIEGFASTSGLVSEVLIPTTNDDVYLSWIGSGLSIGVSGGFSILFDDSEITLQTFEGWKIYRKYLNDATLDKLRGNQINTWNGQWLTYSLDVDSFREDFDFTDLTDKKIFDVSTALVEVNTVNWSQLFFSLSQLYPNGSLTGYVHTLGDINKTIGFIPFYLKSGSRIIDIYKKLFGSTDTDKKRFEALFGMHIKRACELGSIGLQALKPDGITKYMGESKNLSFTKPEDTFNYYAYKTWLIAMLTKNKDEINEYTIELAETILRYKNQGTKNDRKTLIDSKLLASKTKKGFIESLTEMVKDLEGDDLDKIKKLKDEVHLLMGE